jgi:hypothetical protein
MRRRYAAIFKDCPAIPAVVLRDFLRQAWRTNDLRHRDWYLFKFRDFYHQTARRVRQVRMDRRPGEMPVIIPATRAEALEATGRRNDPPPISPIEAAAFYLQQEGKRARCCANAECPAPYFIANKKGQRYCSGECSRPAQRAAKRRWWNNNRAYKASQNAGGSLSKGRLRNDRNH